MNKAYVFSSAAIGLAGVVAAVLLGQAAQGNAAPNSPAARPAAVAAPVKAIDAADPSLTYKQSGTTVTVSRNATVVATITLTKGTYTSSSADLALRVTAAQAFTLDTDRFLVYDSAGGENSVGKARSVQFGPGAHTLTLDFASRHRPEAAGWVPQDGEDAAAVWPRTA